MAKKNGYSVYSNALDMPFKFLGHFKSRKVAADFVKECRKTHITRTHLVVSEERPALEVGANATDWNEYPKNYIKPTR